MANILEYTLSLQDKLSAKLSKITITTDMALGKFAKLELQSKDVSKKFNQLGTNVTSLQSKIQLLKAERDLLPIGSLSAIRKYNSEITKLENTATKLQTLNGSKVKTWFKDALNGLPGIATNPLVLLGAGIGASVKKGMEADMQKANILTLLKGDAEKAKALYKDLSDYGIKSPYDKAGLIDAQQTMMSFGISADSSFEKLQQIGDIAMGDAQKMSSLSLAFAQASSTGRLNGQDLNQMINAGFNPLLVISEKTGESMTSLKDRMAKGKIGIDEVSKAFEIATSEGGDFYKAAENASNTLGGKWSNMMESFNELALSIYEVIQPIITPLIGLVTKIMEKIGEGVGYLIDKLKEGNPVIVAIAGVVGAFTLALILHNTYTSLAAMFQNKLTLAILKTNLAFLANPITWIIAGIIALIAIISYLIYKIDGWGKAWDHTVKAAKLIFRAFVEYHKAQFNTLVQGFMIGIDKIRIAWIKFKEFIGLGDSHANQQMLADLEKSVKDRQKSIIDGYAKAGKLGLDAASELKKAWNSLEWNDKNVVGDLKAKFGIATPGGIPGANGDLTKTSNSEKTKEAQKTNESIATGGTRHNYVTINLKNLVEILNIEGKGFRESASEMERQVLDALLRVTASATTAAG
ncbi:MAG: tape measure protein [Chitinophagaceae bacterium]|nr:tape measure protein [Chitinophagaceae bacterium]